MYFHVAFKTKVIWCDSTMYDRQENLCNKRLRKRIKENVRLQMIFSHDKREIYLISSTKNSSFNLDKSSLNLYWCWMNYKSCHWFLRFFNYDMILLCHLILKVLSMNMFSMSILHNFFSDQLLELSITRSLKSTIVVRSRLNCKKKVNKLFCMHFFQCCFSFMLVADIYSCEFSSIVYHHICDTVVIQLILNQLYKFVVFHVINANQVLHWFMFKKILWSAVYVTIEIVTDLYYENFDWFDWYWLRSLEISFVADDITQEMWVCVQLKRWWRIVLEIILSCLSDSESSSYIVIWSLCHKH